MSKIAPKLSQMPWNIKEKMINYLETEEKLSLRQCSKNFQFHVNRSPIHFKTLDFTFNIEKITVQLDICEGKSVQKIFKSHENGVLMENPSENWSGIRNGGDYRKAAVEQLLKVFETFPNARIGHLRFQIGVEDPLRPWYPSTGNTVHFWPRIPEYRQVIFGELLGNKLKVESISWHSEMNQEEVLSFLELCEPGTLRSISCETSLLFYPQFKMNRVVETEQWKRAKEVSIGHGYCSPNLEHWKHFDVVRLHVFGTLTDTAKTIIETFLNRPTFKYCRLTNCSFDLTGVDAYLYQLDKQMNTSSLAFHDFTIASPLVRNIRFCATVNSCLIYLEKYTASLI